MRHALVLAPLLASITGSALAPVQPITALAPFEVVADGFGSVRGIALDADDRLYVADREAGTVTRLGTDGPRVIARRLERPIGVALDPQGRVLVAEERGGRVVRLDPNGPTPLVAGITQPRWLAVDERGTVFVSARRLTRDAEPEPDDESAEPEMILSLTPDGVLTIFADGFDHLQGLAARHDAVYAATTGPRGVHRQGGVIYRIPVLADGQAGRIARVGPRDVFERPVGLALDALGALYLSAALADLDGPLAQNAIVKLQPDGAATVFASGLDNPRGLAFDRRGHLYIADGSAGRVLRFLAAPAPALTALPPFTRQSAVTLGGATMPRARVDVFVNDGSAPASSLASATGSFAVPIALAPNGQNHLEVVGTAVRGKGLTSPAAEAHVLHDTLAPVVVLQTPPAGAFVRGTVEIRVDAADSGSALATLALSATGQALNPSIVPSLPGPAALATASWDTSAGADGTQALTATATDRAGNSATISRVVIVDNTPPETDITSGPDGTIPSSTATLSFTGADSLTPLPGLQFAWRLDGGPLTIFAPSTSATLTDLAPGAHVFEVVARDQAGNEDRTPARRTFTVGSAGPVLTIAAPPTGASVPAGVLIVRGTVDGGGEEVGVRVNDVAALVHAGQWAVEVPIASGTNAIAAIARSAAGAEATATIAVTGITTIPDLSLRAEPSSGVAPLHVTWRVASQAPRALVRFELDERGDGAYAAPTSTLDGAQSIYTTAGLLFPTLRATDDLGNVHVATTVVQVDDAQTASARFQTLWTGFTARLQAGDQAGALAHLSPSLRSRFESVFQQLGAALPGIAAGLAPIQLIDQVGDLAEAAILQSEDGVTRLYFVYFRRDNRGQWLIQEM
jgi:sugar lactone lactonase YvrE